MRGKGGEIWIERVEGWVGSEPEKEQVMLMEGGAEVSEMRRR